MHSYVYLHTVYVCIAIATYALNKNVGMLAG